MDHLKHLKGQMDAVSSSPVLTTAISPISGAATTNQEEEKILLNFPHSKSSIMSLNGQKISKQVNYFQSPVINNTILNSLAQINPVSLSDNSKAFVIGISGGVSAGKSIITNLVFQSLKTKFNLSVANLVQSDFYKEIREDIKKGDHFKNYNFDEPGAIDWQHFKQALSSLISKQPFSAPVYDMVQEQRSKETQDYRTADVIIVEGTLIFSQESVRNLFDLKIFLDTDEDIRLSRRIYKDVCIRGKDIEQVVHRYLKHTKIGFEKYTLPSKKYADIIIPNYGGGYSASFQEEILAGFGSLDNAALEVIINQIVAKRGELKEKDN